jgi:diguanylate cyclase (GGDEF)-like protein
MTGIADTASHHELDWRDAAWTPVAAPEAGRGKLLGAVASEDELTRRLVARLLAPFFGEVAGKRTGHDVLRSVAERAPHLIVIDAELTDFAAGSLCRELRRAAADDPPYLILLLGADQPRHLVDALESAADDYIVRPLHAQLLTARFRTAERVLRLQEEVRRHDENFRRCAERLTEANRELRRAALIDALTALPNRRYAVDRLAQEWSAATRSGRPLACMMLDIDHFKAVNDHHGHSAGDELLRDLGGILRGSARAGDVVCRLGGDEFVAICPDTDLAGAEHCAERLRSQVAASNLSGHCGAAVTISIGVALRDEAIAGPEVLLRAADRALYAAKRAGRNRVCTLQADTLPLPVVEFTAGASIGSIEFVTA